LSADGVLRRTLAERGQKKSRDASQLRDLAIECRLPPLLTGLCWTPANTAGALDQTLAERL
jgi:hypothetical protein